MVPIRRSIWAAIAFLAGFAVVTWVVSDYFLIPAMLASHDATAVQKTELAAVSRLVLAVVLVVLLISLGMTFRISRFFLPQRGQRTGQKTRYVDAWTEAGKRLNDRRPQ